MNLKNESVREEKKVLDSARFMREALVRFWAQQEANECERRGMQERHFYEWQEMNRRHEHNENPFRVALGDHYTAENVEELASMVRAARKERLTLD